MSGVGVDIAARQAWFEEQAAHAESEWIDFFQERFEGGDDVPDKEHFIALWLAERDPLATDLAAAIARAEAAERDAARLKEALHEAMEWNWLDDDARPSRVADFCDAAIAAQQAEGEDRG